MKIIKTYLLNKYIGYYDGNPATLNKLSPEEAGKNYVALAGGGEALLRKAKVAFEVFNAGGEVNNYTKQGIVDAILEQLPNAQVKYKEHGVDPRNYRVDFSKVKKILDFNPKYTVPDGIEEVLKAFENHTFDHVDDQRNVFGNYELQYPVM